MNIKGYTLVNGDKIERALNGTPRGNGTPIGGVGAGAYYETGVWKLAGRELDPEETDALENAVLAEYDKIGGLILDGKDKVKTGSFFDFKGKSPRKTPAIVHQFAVNGKVIDVPAGANVPGEVRALKYMQEQEEQETVTSEESEDGDVEEKPKKGKGKK